MNPNDQPEPTKQPNADDQQLPIDPEEIETEDEVDEASDDSFPASDPPSYSRSTTAKD
jgi:hypothetical protein